MELIDKKKRILIIGAHFLVWLVLFGLPLLMFFNSPDNSYQHLFRAWLPLFFFAILFYLNYLLLTDRYLFKKKFALYFLFNSLLVIVIFLAMSFLKEMILFDDMMHKMKPMDGVSFEGNMPPIDFKSKPSMALFMFMDFMFLLIPIGLSLALKIGEKWIRVEREKNEIETKQLETELLHLRYQLQPHFFFNSLNNIYSLVDYAPLKAKEAIHSLSKLMRYLLYETEQKKVDLAQELYFLERYIQLMELRLTDKTKTSYVFPEKVPQKYYIAPLLFIPLIENAYKHGTSTLQESIINFQIALIGDRIHFSSENSNFPKDENDKSISGIGIENLKKRLQLIYPEKFLFNSGVRGDKYCTVLIIDLG
jgi:hypothetical protein